MQSSVSGSRGYPAPRILATVSAPPWTRYSASHPSIPLSLAGRGGGREEGGGTREEGREGRERK